MRRFLVTTDNQEERLRFWMHTSVIANWIDGRENRHGTDTWIVTVLEPHCERFLARAQRDRHVTVEAIDGDGEDETYRLLVGEPGTGWGPDD